MRMAKIAERKLGRERAWGQYWPDGGGRIEIDPRLRSRGRLRVLIHEALHHVFKSAGETQVTNAAGIVALILWRDGFRRIEK